VRTTAVVLVFVALVAACGQKPGVRDEVALQDRSPTQQEGGNPDSQAEANPELEGGEPGSGTDPANAGADAAEGAGDRGGDGAGSGGADGGGSPDDGGDTGSGAGAAEGSGGDAGGSGNGASGPTETRGQDRTGVSDDTIRIGAHAPVTGAAPLPAPAFEEASDLYYRWYTEQQGREVLGRSNVEVTFANDQYQPSTAAQACRQLARNHFLLFGAGGTDQIQQCARLAEQGSFPYFSAGVTEAGLGGLNWYFALSMTYRAQGDLLAQRVASQYGGRRAAAIVTNTETSTTRSRVGRPVSASGASTTTTRCATRGVTPAGTRASPASSPRTTSTSSTC
jgi:hypothetical protein